MEIEVHSKSSQKVAAVKLTSKIKGLELLSSEILKLRFQTLSIPQALHREKEEATLKALAAFTLFFDSAPPTTARQKHRY